MSLSPTLLGQVFIRKCCVFSGVTLLLYDFLITFPREVQYIWKAPWTPVKIGFLLNRYGNAIGQSFIMIEETGYLNPSEEFCGIFRTYCALFIVLSAESIRILVLMRAWAIWGYHYYVAICLITLYGIYVLAVITAMLYASSTVSRFSYDYLSQVGICLTAIDPYMWLMWLATIALDSITLAMVWYSLRKISNELQVLYPSPLIRFLIRDAVLFYAASTFNSVFSIISWTVFSQDPRVFLQLALSSPLLSVIGQRVILNLRGYQARSLTTRELSKEVDRQIAAFGDRFRQDLWHSTASYTTGSVEPGIELAEMGHSL